MLPPRNISARGRASYGNLYNMIRKSPRITLYSTSRCAHCRQLKQWLQQHRITFREMDIQRNPRALREFQQHGGRGVPLLRIGDQVVRGFDSKRITKLLRAARVLTESSAH